MFSKILIANRGEIACRVIKTARKMGIKTVAVFSDADRKALHVQMADEAVHIGASTASQSYIDIKKIVGAAKSCGAEAIHPGYGFLSENSKFAGALKKAKIAFTAYDMAIYGQIDGIVTKVAANTTQNEDGSSFYITTSIYN